MRRPHLQESAARLAHDGRRVLDLVELHLEAIGGGGGGGRGEEVRPLRTHAAPEAAALVASYGRLVRERELERGRQLRGGARPHRLQRGEADPEVLSLARRPARLRGARRSPRARLDAVPHAAVGIEPRRRHRVVGGERADGVHRGDRRVPAAVDGLRVAVVEFVVAELPALLPILGGFGGGVIDDARRGHQHLPTWRAEVP